jgi:hypothetical protein
VRDQSGGQWEHARDRDPARRFRGAGRRRPLTEDGGRHGPADLHARRPSRPSRPACTAPVTAHARTPHGSLHGPPTARCTAYYGFLPRRPSRASTPGAPVISSSIRRSNLPPPGFRWCGDRATTTPSTAPARPFTAFSRRSQVLGEEPWWGRDGVAWDRWLEPCKNLQTYASETPRPASRQVLLYVFAQR